MTKGGPAIEEIKRCCLSYKLIFLILFFLGFSTLILNVTDKLQMYRLCKYDQMVSLNPFLYRERLPVFKNTIII